MAVAVVASVFVAVVGALLALPGGNVVGDTTTNVRIDTPLPGLEPGDSVIQSFVATEDRLASVYVTFGTFNGTAECDITVWLEQRRGTADVGSGTPITSGEWACGDLADTGRFEVLDFTPLEDSAGQVFDVVIERTDDGTGQGVVVWAGAPKGDALPVIVDGEVVPDLSALVRAEYDPQPHRWDHMARTLERLGAYGPSWGAPLLFVMLVLALAIVLSATPLSLRSTRALLIVVAILAILRGLIWSAAIPAFEAMDEPAHFAYVQYVAEEHLLPGHVDNHEIFSPSLEAAIDELNVESTVPGDRPDYSEEGEERTESALDGVSSRGGGGAPGSMYAPFYYLPAVPFYEAAGDDILGQVALARLWSVLLGAVAAVLLVLVGRRLFPGSDVAQAAFVVAGVFQPMVAHQFAIVNNDAWVIVTGFAALALGLELTRRGRAPGLALLAGVVIGAGLLGKPFAIACAVPLAAGWVVGKFRARQRSLRVLGGEAGLVVVGVAATFGLWTLNAARLDLNTSEVPSSTATGQSLAEFLDVNFGGRLSAVKAIWGDQLWGDFGWVRIPLPEPVPWLIVAIEAALVLGLLIWAVVMVGGLLRARTARRAVVVTDGRRAAQPWTADSDAQLRSAPIPLDVRILILAVTIVGIVVTLYAAGWLYYASTGRNDLIQGRYALLAVPALLAGPALVLERLSHGRIRPAVVNVLAAFGMVSANLLGLLVVLEAFYG